jgi:methionyl-tRNA synthetase
MDGPRFYLTTPIYYVNDRPHIGHAYTTVLADCLARYRRAEGRTVHFLTGTDEHGQKVEAAARKRGLAPRDHCDETVKRFQQLWQRLRISHDDFIRTTEPRHTSSVRKALQRLFEKGEIYAGDYRGWYCTPCERFWTGKDLAAGNCPECARPVKDLTEKNYFFKMSRHREWLISHIEEHADFILPDFRRNEVLGFLRKPLEDLCISRPRARLAWGIDLPFDPDYVTYVWVDALLNYATAVGYLREEEPFARWWPADVHLIGKDILTTHAVYWPTLLHALELPLPRTILAHGWWRLGGAKMSKSEGNVVNPLELADRFGVDPFRFFLIRAMAVGQDADFTEEPFQTCYQTDLVNNVGNLCSRTVSMTARFCQGRSPPVPEPAESEISLVKRTDELREALLPNLDSIRLDRIAHDALGLAEEINRYLERQKPWERAKDPDRSHETGRTLAAAAEALRIASTALQPIMPESMNRVLERLGCSTRFRLPDELVWQTGRTGAPVLESPPLFPRHPPPASASA